MGEQTGISWTGSTFNPWFGCQKVSPACTNCYAETFTKRIGLKVWGPDSDRKFFSDKHWNEPLRWNKKAAAAGVRHRVFCASMADVFEDRPDLVQERERLWRLIEATPWLDWQLLTKRPENITRLMPGPVRPNVWVGTTVEDQKWAEVRLPELVKVPAVVRFVSYEPALGAVDFTPWAHDLHWIIAGGESGAHVRPPDHAWFRAVRDQCAAAGIAYFFKQHGGRFPGEGGCLLDGREWKEFPEVAA